MRMLKTPGYQTVADAAAPKASAAPMPPTHYVGIGASAGGLEAIEAFFREMPAKSGLVFVVVQHLSPDYKSLMVELLSKRTQMPVFRAEEGMAVEPDAIYLIPPKKNLTIFHGKLLLKEQDQQRGINLPIDIYFRSLAEDQGEKAIAIVLSGTGSDGTRGIRSIKEHGGMVMVQDEHSAKFDGMPRSAIATGLVDFILPPTEMPRHLLSFLKHPYVSRTERSETLTTDEDDLTRVFALLRDQFKVDFTYYKPSTVNRRIERRISVNQIQDLAEYVDLLEKNPAEVANLYRELLIGVTSFFRDREAYDRLAHKWLPELIRNKSDRNLRLWVVGCSTGEEAYTLAILCRECLEDHDKSLDVKIFATDVDRDAIVQAGSGVFPESIAADLSPRLLNKYFFKRDDNFQVVRNIREMVVFAQHNLIKDPPFTSIDMISCRNLLIYLQPVLQTKAMELFNFSLQPAGLLMLGTSESTGEMGDYFQTLESKYKIFKSLGRQKPLHSGSSAVTSRTRHLSNQDPRPVGQRPLAPFFEDRMLDRLLDLLSEEYVPLTVVVNEKLEILHIIGRTEGYIHVPPGRMDNDLSKMIAKDLALPLATSIQKVFETRKPVTYANIRVRRLSAEATVNIKVAPLPEKYGRPPLVAVFLEEMDKKDRVEDPGEPAAYDISREAEQRIHDLEQQLQFTRENLQATIEELETSNEELQATNEELLASNEELQSTNEELQSVNEELHTVNAEHHRKIIELTELNNDLENMHAGARVGMLFLDENLELRRYTPQISKVFNLLEADIGRPFDHLSHRLADVPVGDLVRSVQRSGETMEREVLSEQGIWYLMRILPYRVAPQTYSGVVLSLSDIHLMKTAQAALEAIRQEHTLTQHTTNTGTWSMDLETGACQWSDTMASFLGVDLEGLSSRFEDYLAAVHAEDRESVAKAVQTSRQRRLPLDIEHRTSGPDGVIRWLAINGVITRDPGGNEARMFCVVKDVSDHMHSKDVERRLENIACSLADVILVHDLTNQIRAWNHEAEQIYGWDPEEVFGMSVMRLIPPAYQKGYQEIVERIARGEAIEGVKTRRITKSGREIEVWLKAAPILDRRGRPEAVAITERVISERSTTEVP
jgi:two-component system CheB/CheR fusion protein